MKGMLTRCSGHPAEKVCLHGFEAEAMSTCLQVLTKAALMSYERLHVFEGILDRDWNPPHGTPVSPGADPSAEYASKLLCAWQFDEITSGECPARCMCIALAFKFLRAQQSHNSGSGPPMLWVSERPRR